MFQKESAIWKKPDQPQLLLLEHLPEWWNSSWGLDTSGKHLEELILLGGHRHWQAPFWIWKKKNTHSLRDLWDKQMKTKKTQKIEKIISKTLNMGERMQGCLNAFKLKRSLT